MYMTLLHRDTCLQLYLTPRRKNRPHLTLVSQSTNGTSALRSGG